MSDQMAKDITADLASESKRDAKGVDWARYQAVCDELESLQYSIEEGCTPADARVLRKANHDLAAELEEAQGRIETLEARVKAFDKGGLNWLMADAIREAVETLRTEQTIGGTKWLCRVVELVDYADKLEAGEL
jgi:hypothetical protein